MDAEHERQRDKIRRLIAELGCLKVALAALGEWGHVENVEETIQMTHELLKQTEKPLYH